MGKELDFVTRITLSWAEIRILEWPFLLVFWKINVGIDAVALTCEYKQQWEEVKAGSAPDPWIQESKEKPRVNCTPWWTCRCHLSIRRDPGGHSRHVISRQTTVLMQLAASRDRQHLDLSMWNFALIWRGLSDYLITLHKTHILSKYRLCMFENRALRKIFETKVGREICTVRSFIDCTLQIILLGCT